jgi:hypothetical protein
VRNSDDGYWFYIYTTVNYQYSQAGRLCMIILPHIMRRREVPKYTVKTPQRNAHKPPTCENPARTDSSLESEVVIHSDGSSCRKTRKVEVLRNRGMSGEIPVFGSVKTLITRAIMTVFDCYRYKEIRVRRRRSKKLNILRVALVQKFQRSCTVVVTRDSEYPSD